MQTQSSQQDDWSPQNSNKPAKSIFQKMHIKFTNEQIEQNVEQMLSQPHYYNDQDIDPQDRPKQGQKYESLYNPLQDDQNQIWVNKNYTNVSKPLTCPNCFSQLAHSYKKGKNGSQHNYQVQKPTNIEVLETKIIRNRQCPQQMDINLNTVSDPSQVLAQRQEQFNVKIVCVCACGVQVGYYDVNLATYILVNVV